MKQHAYVSIVIPTNQSFLEQQYAWTHGKVARHFKRDKERVLDTVQNVRVRLLQKDFIGRWFFKHLTNELVDRSQAERILGGISIISLHQLKCADIPNLTCENAPCVKRHMAEKGCVRSCKHSLWRISDILAYAKYDHDRYYYSMQGHTIDSARVLKLLGYPENQYSLLQSLYRQGRLRPSELTEHECTGGECAECEHGRALLFQRKLSLAHNWSDPVSFGAAAKLRWNDRQLQPFLREWHNTNMISTTPHYIMRTDKTADVNAGLYRYAEMIIDNEVVNDFKRISRSDDMDAMVFNKGRSPELANSDTVAWEAASGSGRDDPDGEKTKVLRDCNAHLQFSDMENFYDLNRLTESARLTPDEEQVIDQIDLGEVSVRDFSTKIGKPIQKVHRVRQSALKKLRDGEISLDSQNTSLAASIASKYNCTVEDIFSNSTTIGPAVRARTDFFSSLYDSGMSILKISFQYGVPEDRVVAAINRACIRESRRASI